MCLAKKYLVVWYLCSGGVAWVKELTPFSPPSSRGRSFLVISSAFYLQISHHAHNAHEEKQIT